MHTYTLQRMYLFLALLWAEGEEKRKEKKWWRRIERTARSTSDLRTFLCKIHQSSSRKSKLNRKSMWDTKRYFVIHLLNKTYYLSITGPFLRREESSQHRRVSKWVCESIVLRR